MSETNGWQTGRTAIAVATACVCGVGLASLMGQDRTEGPAVVPPAAVTKWEYKAIPREAVALLAPGYQNEYIRPADLLEGLNAGLASLGREGWELVAVEPYHKEGYVSWPTLYVFRRAR